MVCGMAEVLLDIDWDGQPFAYPDEGGPAWPGPLVRPVQWQAAWTEKEYGPKITIPDELLARWQQVQADLIEVQAELTRLGKEQGAFR
jgi:hypothetical protein